MKLSRSEVLRTTHTIPVIRFEDQALTSFSGLVIFQALFAKLNLKERLRWCFSHCTVSPIFGQHLIVLLLTVHLLLGYRWLRDSRYYRDDPMVKRLLGLERLPDVSTVSRSLLDADQRSVARLAALIRRIVLEGLSILGLRRLTLDFDGSVQSTRRLAEGTAVGFNKKRKGDRSYYPLFCTVAQTGQVFAVLHRPGNVHDSRDAKAFVLRCIEEVRAALREGRVGQDEHALRAARFRTRERHRAADPSRGAAGRRLQPPVTSQDGSCGNRGRARDASRHIAPNLGSPAAPST